MPPRPLYDIPQYNYDKPLYSIDEIRKVNPQRHEMEQLTAIVHVDRENDGIVGFKDISDNEFWCTGHMPGFPLMPDFASTVHMIQGTTLEAAFCEFRDGKDSAILA